MAIKAGQTVVANENGKKGYLIPVSWQANSLEEAHAWMTEHSDEIKLGTEPSYVESSYEIGSVEECRIYFNEMVEYAEGK